MILVYFALGSLACAWLVTRERRQLAIEGSSSLRRMLANGNVRELEHHLRQELALVSAGEAVAPEREWLARAQLAGLMVAQWRLDEAEVIYSEGERRPSPEIEALARLGRYELELLTRTPSQQTLDDLRTEKDATRLRIPAPYRRYVEQAWEALIGLCLVRMGHAREAIDPLARSLRVLNDSPSRLVYLFHLAQAYEQIGERQLAEKYYQGTAQAFPGTRLANEAKTRMLALAPDSGGRDPFFRRMLPESPVTAALVPRSPESIANDASNDAETGDAASTGEEKRSTWWRRRRS
jgi:tetratricopeptide (TPR) repeat protein